MESDHTSLLLNCFLPLSHVYPAFPTYPAFTPHGLKYHIRLTIPVFLSLPKCALHSTLVFLAAHLAFPPQGHRQLRVSKPNSGFYFTSPNLLVGFPGLHGLLATVESDGYQNLEHVVTLF